MAIVLVHRHWIALHTETVNAMSRPCLLLGCAGALAGMLAAGSFDVQAAQAGIHAGIMQEGNLRVAQATESSPPLPLPPPVISSAPTVPPSSGDSPPVPVAPSTTQQEMPTNGSGPPQVAAQRDTASPGDRGATSPGDRETLQTGKPKPSSKLTLWGILNAGGTVGLLILLLSLATVALAVEQALTLRKSVLIPDSLAAEVRDAMMARDGKRAVELCRKQPCLLAHVLLAGISEWEAGWSEVEKAVEDALAEQSARLLRKVEYLSVIGNLAPMLGLLGTVVGMILAFRTVAETQGAARAADLAEAIYLALITTVEGLIVAIPALALYAYFRNRADEVTAEAASLAQRALMPLKRRRAAVRPPSPPPKEGACG